MDAPEPFLPTLQAANGIVFLNNPPYKTANEQSFTTSVKRHGGLSATPVKQVWARPACTRQCGGTQFAVSSGDAGRGPNRRRQPGTLGIVCRLAWATWQ